MPVPAGLADGLLLEGFHDTGAHGEKRGEQNGGQGNSHNGDEVAELIGFKALEGNPAHGFFIFDLKHSGHHL
ncbi:hypothetical protein SDC9_152579 [bioreactor metagenome]|uniref:Uncharacterized protein n=1 Tax=bioreactor metagenome TaxID=1076179 RepID=A0A645EVU2_9ZZZZ